MELNPVNIENHIRENWKPVVGYEGLYEVSDYGRVKSLGRITRNWRGKVRLSARVLKPATKVSGHKSVSLHRDGKAKTHSVHRLVLIAFRGEPPFGTEACHNNGNPGDNRLDNLRWDTRKSNKADEKKHGRNYQSSKTHCNYGHPLEGENLAVFRPNTRTCRACAARRVIEHRERKRVERARAESSHR